MFDDTALVWSVVRGASIGVATWAGRFEGETLIYAAQPHPEFKKYHNPDTLIVSTLDGKVGAAQPGTKEPA